MSTHVLLPLAVNSKSERKVDSLPPLGFEPVTFGTLAHFSDRSAKSHPDKSIIPQEISHTQQHLAHNITIPGDISVCRFMGSLDDLGKFLSNAETDKVLGRLNLREKEENPPPLCLDP
jgi:hypothetical protein